MTALKRIDPHELKDRLASGACVLIDIREADEHARARIPGAKLTPASTLDEEDFAVEALSGKTVVFHCRSGARTEAHAARIAGKGLPDAHILHGGLEAWEKAGLPIARNTKAPLEIMRQVQIAAGVLILTGILLAIFVDPAFLGLTAFVGAGLTFAGITGFCGMARLLALMPWNRRTAAPA
jgi:rhodanese-related sulfurtransferase